MRYSIERDAEHKLAASHRPAEPLLGFRQALTATNDAPQNVVQPAARFAHGRIETILGRDLPLGWRQAVTAAPIDTHGIPTHGHAGRKLRALIVRSQAFSRIELPVIEVAARMEPGNWRFAQIDRYGPPFASCRSTPLGTFDCQFAFDQYSAHHWFSILDKRRACKIPVLVGKQKNRFGYYGQEMINRIRDIRKQKGWTLADLADACTPPTTPQTVGRLETGMRNLSLRWMERIAAALDVDPEVLVRSENTEHPQVVASLGRDGAEALVSPRDAILATELGGDGPLVVLTVEYPHGEYRPGDQLWLRQLAPEEAGRAVNRDVLVPRKGGRFAFGRLIDRKGSLVGILPPGHGEKQQVVENPAWVAVAEMLVRRL